MTCTDVAPNWPISVSPSVTKSSQGRVTMTTAACASPVGRAHTIVEVGPPDEGENLSEVVEDLDRGRGVVHGG